MPEENSSSIGVVEEVALELLDIGTAQIRTDLTSGIDDLAASIRKQGLLHPIHVVRKTDGRYEILAGQRRVIAHEKLGLKTIRAVVRDADMVDEYAKVGVSLTENLVRRDPSQKELIDACTKLHKHYLSNKMVAQEIGISTKLVSKYVKYDSLVEPLKEMVDNAKLDMKVALQAQRAAESADGTVDEEAAKKFAVELAPMSNQQKKSFVKAVTSDPTSSLEERIEKGRKQPVLKQVIITLEESLHAGLQGFAKDEGVNQDEAAASLVEDGLARRGFLSE